MHEQWSGPGEAPIVDRGGRLKFSRSALQSARSKAGLSLALVSAAGFGSSGVFAASLLATGWSAGAVVLVPIALAALVLTGPALALLRGRLALLRGTGPGLVTYGVVAVAGGQLCFFNAVRTLPVAVALLLTFGGIGLVVVWTWVRHGQRPGRLTALGGLSAVAGLTFVLDLFGKRTLDAGGIAWALGAAVGLATYFLVSARSEDVLPPLAVAWAGLTIGAVTVLVAALAGGLAFSAPRTSVTLASGRMSWMVPILAMSLLATAIAFVTGILGARLLGAQLASFVGLTEILFGVLFAWLLLGQIPGPTQVFGGVLVLVGIGLVRLDEPQPHAAI